MQKYGTFICFLLALFLKFGPVRAAEPDWSVDMASAGACCCDPVCPCLFGSASTHGHCKVNNLYLIKSGHYEQVLLDGMSIVTTEEMGQWRRFYIAQEASEEQVDAVVKLFDVIPGFEINEVKSIEKVPIIVKWQEELVHFSTPHSEVEMAAIKGRGGKPIRIENLLLDEDYVQFKTTTHKYKGYDLEFDYSGTHASTTRISARNDSGVKPADKP